MKLCVDCGVQECLKMTRKRNTTHYPRCKLCQRKYNRKRASKLRLEQKRKELLQNSELELTGWKRCSNCYRKKMLSEFSTRYSNRRGKLHKICDTCLSRLLANNHKELSTFSTKYWRKRAYACNSTYRNRLYRITRKRVPLAALDFIVKPQHLIALFQTQHSCCYYCNIQLTPDTLSCDHTIPICREGKHHINNIRLTCVDCNQLKQARTEEEFKQFLRTYATRVLELQDKEPVG